MPKKKRRRPSKLLQFKDFVAVMALPERLAQFIRALCVITPAEWEWMKRKIDKGEAYRERSISKGTGRGWRQLAEPCPELMGIQQKILNRFLNQIPVHFSRHGNQRGSSIITNVLAHAGFAQSVFSVDLINAFPSVLRSRLRANLRKPFQFALRQFAGIEFEEAEVKEMLEALIDLVCLHDRLPQGSPASGRLLDICCMKLDQEIFALLYGHSNIFRGYRETAYADDLTISANGEIPVELREAILQVIRDNGFIPHTRQDKTKYFSRETGTIPVVTGLTILPNGRIGIAPRKLNQIRARLTQLKAKTSWSRRDFGQANGTLGHLRAVYPDKLPRKFGIATLVSQITELIKTRGRVANTQTNRALRAATKTAPIVAFVDGASRGNPGESAIGVMILRDKRELDSFANLIGTATNNQAEYLAVIAALERIKRVGAHQADIFSDSQVVVDQLAGRTKVKSMTLRPLFIRAKELSSDIGVVRFRHINREQNIRADALANAALDGHVVVGRSAA